MDVMKVFIGWSGETSKEIASILKNWLNGMFDGHVSAFTPDDLAPGSLWFEGLSHAMTDADCGLLCVTADNVNSQWLAYEAGALSQSVKLLIPILFEVSSLWVDAPLRMFQPISFGIDGMRELTRTLNQSGGDKRIPPPELERRFEARYPAVEMVVKEKLPESAPLMDNSVSSFLERVTQLDKTITELEKRAAELKKKQGKKEKSLAEREDKDFPQNSLRKNSSPNREISL